ncbi:MAG: SEC-C metal-binding domain-containing protein [Muribaculum sp.]|nr:SEC-C metal-binding domain-containing protein [Muribaculum sp.]
MCDTTADSYKRIVSEINHVYKALSSISNDDLRRRVKEIDNSIKTAENVALSIDGYLVEVYAIVKETARRFSLGNIEVIATEHDRRLADNFDFVTIKEDKAIYQNHWQVGGVPFQWDMVHYDEQILGGIHLHYGHAIEMATGEGKTLVAIPPIFLNALTHKGVHLMTVNDYLSKRDYEITRPLYMFHGLTADCLENYKRWEYSYKSSYASDIVFGENSTFVFDYLWDHLALDKKDCVQRNHNYAIIDELDSILIDDADNPHIVSGGIPYSNEKIYKENLPLIKEMIEDKSSQLFLINNLGKEVTLTKEGELWLCERFHNASLFKYHKTYENENFDQLPQDEKDEIYNNIRLQNVIHNLLLAHTVYVKDEDYVVTGNKVVILDQNTGRLRESSRWEHGLHTAIEVKENVSVQPDRDGMAVISLKNYFKLYNKICGMSGTIIEASEELSEIYGLHCERIPTHKPSCRIDMPLQIYRTAQLKDDAIIKAVNRYHNGGQPTLIGSLSIKRADEIEKHLLEEGLHFNRLDAKTTKDEAHTVAKAGLSNTITLSTSVAGRGTDIKPSEDAIANGGLCVIGTDLFGSKRTDLQLTGRTGRQGNPGRTVFFSSLEDLILDYLTKEEREELNEIVQNIQGDNLSFDSVRYYFQLAQSKREAQYRAKRKKTAQKDDIVAPRRAKFYKQRNSVLFHTETVDEIISDISTTSGTSITELDSILVQHYPKTIELIQRYRRNNSLVSQAYIPFSDRRRPFAIKMDIDMAMTNKQYFIQEFKRQCILQIYDLYWKDFASYMLQDLDQHEVDSLDNRYSKMMEEISSAIISRLLNSSVTFEIRNNHKDELNPKNDLANPQLDKRNIPLQDDLCPCGSGKKFGDCHGKNNPRLSRRIR